MIIGRLSGSCHFDAQGTDTAAMESIAWAWSRGLAQKVESRDLQERCLHLQLMPSAILIWQQCSEPMGIRRKEPHYLIVISMAANCQFCNNVGRDV